MKVVILLELPKNGTSPGGSSVAHSCLCAAANEVTRRHPEMDLDDMYAEWPPEAIQEQEDLLKKSLAVCMQYVGGFKPGPKGWGGIIGIEFDSETGEARVVKPNQKGPGWV